MRFNIEDLVAKYQDEDWHDIIIKLEREVSDLDNRDISSMKKHNLNFSECAFYDYKAHAKDFLYFLKQGDIPCTTGSSGMRKFLPIIKNLIDKGQIDKSMLNKIIDN